LEDHRGTFADLPGSNALNPAANTRCFLNWFDSKIAPEVAAPYRKFGPETIVGYQGRVCCCWRRSADRGGVLEVLGPESNLCARNPCANHKESPRGQGLFRSVSIIRPLLSILAPSHKEKKKEACEYDAIRKIPSRWPIRTKGRGISLEEHVTKLSEFPLWSMKD